MASMLIITITVLVVSIITAYLGTFMLSRRMSLTAGPLGHLALPGIALAFLLKINLFFGVVVFILFGALLMWLLKKISRLHFEALTGIVFAFGLSIGFLFLPMNQVKEAVLGNINSINEVDMFVSIIIGVLTIVTITIIRKKLALIIISEELAKSLKINVMLYDLVFLMLIALVVATEVKIVGGILTVAMFIIPASSAFQITKSFKTYQFLSIVIAVISVAIGLILFNSIHLPAGPLIILIQFSIFLLSCILHKIATRN